MVVKNLELVDVLISRNGKRFFKVCGEKKFAVKNRDVDLLIPEDEARKVAESIMRRLT